MPTKSQKKRILLVSSDTDAHSRCKKALSSEYSLRFAKSGKDGLALLSSPENQVDLVILDSLLEDILVQEWIRNVGESGNLPYIIVITPDTVPGWMIESMKAGAMDLVKRSPYYESELAIAVRQGFDHQQMTHYLRRSLQQAKTQSVQDRLSAFLDLYLKRRSEGNVVSPTEIALFFPAAQSTQEIPFETVIEAIHSKKGYALLKEWKDRPVLLIVEDDPALLESLTTSFKQDCRVIAAKSAEEALALCENEPSVDVAILDIGLPGVSGDDFVAPLKEAYPDIEIVMLTAYREHRLVAKTVNAGAGDYILKPHDSENLKHRVFSLLQASVLNRVLARYMVDKSS